MSPQMSKSTSAAKIVTTPKERAIIEPKTSDTGGVSDTQIKECWDPETITSGISASMTGADHAPITSIRRAFVEALTNLNVLYEKEVGKKGDQTPYARSLNFQFSALRYTSMKFSHLLTGDLVVIPPKVEDLQFELKLNIVNEQIAAMRTLVENGQRAFAEILGGMASVIAEIPTAIKEAVGKIEERIQTPSLENRESVPPVPGPPTKGVSKSLRKGAKIPLMCTRCAEEGHIAFDVKTKTKCKKPAAATPDRTRVRNLIHPELAIKKMVSSVKRSELWCLNCGGNGHTKNGRRGQNEVCKNPPCTVEVRKATSKKLKLVRKSIANEIRQKLNLNIAREIVAAVAPAEKSRTSTDEETIEVTQGVSRKDRRLNRLLQHKLETLTRPSVKSSEDDLLKKASKAQSVVERMESVSRRAGKGKTSIGSVPKPGPRTTLDRPSPPSGFVRPEHDEDAMFKSTLYAYDYPSSAEGSDAPYDGYSSEYH